MSHTLGIDIGTYESKGVVVDAEGTIVATAATPHRMIVPQAGWAEHRPREDWWGDFVTLSRRLLEGSGVPPRSVRAVAASAIGPCMLPLDGAGEPLMNGVLYGVDTRAVREIDELTAEIGEARLIERCGNALTAQSVGPKILWLRRNRPEIFARTRKILTATSYIVYRLTGRFVIDHYTAAGWSPLYDVDAQAWSAELARGIVDPGCLPDLAWSSEIVGAVTEAAAAETGLAAGTPVIAGTADAAAEAVSVGVLAPGDMMLMYGSTVFIIMPTATPLRDPRLWYAPWLFPGEHAALSGLATSGTLTHWFRDTFTRDLDPATAVQALTAEAEQSPPGAKGLIVLPYFSGERTPLNDPRAKGMVFGLDLTHSRGDLFRAVLEGIAHGTRHIVDTYVECGHEPRTIFAVGGGTRNRVWAQATSDVLARRQVVRRITIGASFGNAFLAALAVGDVAFGDIAAWNATAAEFVPDGAKVELYRQRHAVYRALYPRTRDLMHQSADS